MQRCAAAVVASRVPPGSTPTPVHARNRALLTSAAMLARLRALGGSPDAFVYGAAVFILHEFGLPLPYFRGSPGGGPAAPGSRSGSGAAALSADPKSWSIEQVAQWVAGQSFRAYRQAFRAQLVCGQMLLELTDEDCAEALGMASRLHRRAVLLAVERLREAHAHHAEASGDARGGGPPLRRGASLPQVLDSPMFDCFISYRRAGGADFAQLLKVCGERRGEGAFFIADIPPLPTRRCRSKLPA